MVQVLPERESFGEIIGRGLGGGASQGFLSHLQNSQEKKSKMDLLKEQSRLEQEGKQADLLRKLQGVDQFKKTPAYDQLSDMQKFALENEVAGLISGGSSKSLINAEREAKGYERFADLTGMGGSGQANEESMPGSPSQNLMEGVDDIIDEPSQKFPSNKKSPKSKLEAMSDTELTAHQGHPDKNIAAAAKAEADRRRQEREFGFKSGLAARKEIGSSYTENQPYIDKTYDQYEDSLRRDAILDRMNELSENGELSDSGVINLLESLGLNQEWLKNPANEEYTKLALDLLGGGTLQADYGSRVLQSEFKVSQQRIPNLMQTSEGRRQIAENIKTMLLPAKLKHERMQFYLDQAQRTGKPLPHDLRGRVLKDIKPQLEEAYDKFKQRNGRYEVKKGTFPDDSALEKYFYLSNGNEEKAMKMMREDGYDIESE